MSVVAHVNSLYIIIFSHRSLWFLPLCENNLYINSTSRLIPDMCPLSRFINSAYIVKIYTFSNTKCFLKVAVLYSNVVFMYRLIASVVLVSCEFVLPLGRLCYYC